MIATDKAVALVVNLLRLTQQGKISWEPTHTYHEDGDIRQPAGTAYLTQFEDRKFRLYSYQHYTDQDLALFTQGRVGWTTRHRLDILDRQNHLLDYVDDVHGLSDLMNAVRLTASGVDDLLEKLKRA